MNEALDRLPAGYIAFRDDGAIAATNATLQAMLGYEADALIGTSIESILSLPSRIFYETHFFPLLRLKGEVSEVYLKVKKKSGDQLPVLVNGRRTMIDDQPLNECLWIVIENRNQYEDEILRARREAEEANKVTKLLLQQLEDAYSELNLKQNQLSLRNEELEILRSSLEIHVRDRTKDLEQIVSELQSFTYSIAHTLRAPLRAISSTSSLLIEDGVSEANAALLGRQKRNVVVLASLIEDILQLSRLSVKQPNKEEVNLSNLACELFQDAVGSRDDFKLSIEQDLTVVADRTMLEQLISALASNAVKFSPSGGSIQLATRRDNGETIYAVSDKGIGLQPEYHSKIFTMFERLHREEYEGNGIGLTIAARVVLHHGGRIWVESELNKGATFLFTLSPSAA